VALRLGAALAGLIIAVVAAQLVSDGRRDASPRETPQPATGSLLPPAELAGEWSGEGTLARCAGFDEGCPGRRSVTLTIDCAQQPCVVTPFDGRYGRPPVDVEEASYQASGPVPAALAPTCDGAPAATALWRLDLTVRAGRLVGSYAESTLQGFDCGATGVAWTLTLERP
jgi:hypothetical protein